MTLPRWASEMGRKLRLFVFRNDVLRSSKLRGDQAAIMRLYRLFAPIYDWIFPHFASFRATIHRLVDRFIRDGDRILDLGAGTGIVSLEILPRARYVLALDLQSAMLQVARKKADQRGDGGKLGCLQASATVLPLRSGSFEGVVSSFMEVYLDIPDKQRMLKEVHRVLVPGGRVTFITGVGELSGRYIGRHDWEELLAGTGFTDVTFEDLHEVYRLVSARRA